MSVDFEISRTIVDVFVIGSLLTIIVAGLALIVTSVFGSDD